MGVRGKIVSGAKLQTLAMVATLLGEPVSLDEMARRLGMTHNQLGGRIRDLRRDGRLGYIITMNGLYVFLWVDEMTVCPEAFSCAYISKICEAHAKEYSPSNGNCGEHKEEESTINTKDTLPLFGMEEVKNA